MIGYRRPRRASLKVVGIVALVIMGPWVLWAYWPHILGLVIGAGKWAGWWQ